MRYIDYVRKHYEKIAYDNVIFSMSRRYFENIYYVPKRKADIDYDSLHNYENDDNWFHRGDILVVQGVSKEGIIFREKVFYIKVVTAPFKKRAVKNKEGVELYSDLWIYGEGELFPGNTLMMLQEITDVV